MSELEPLPLSVLIITNRSQLELQPTLASVSWAAEVIVIKKELIEDFAAERNEALKKVNQPWVLFIDGDEVVCKIDQGRLLEVMSEGPDTGIAVRRVDVFKGQRLRFGEVRNVWIPRLFRRGMVRYERAVHEVPVVEGSIYEIENFALEIEHHSHESVTSFFQKVTRYAFLEAQFRAKQGEQFNLFQCLFFPMGKFFYNGLIKLGFLDGWRGLVYLLMMSLHSFFVRIYLYEAQHSPT
jgi:hypothetical protein